MLFDSGLVAKMSSFVYFLVVFIALFSLFILYYFSYSVLWTEAGVEGVGRGCGWEMGKRTHKLIAHLFPQRVFF
jgi:hypothetical protein